MGLHYILIIIAIAFIVVFQLYVFNDTKKRVNVFKKIFPENDNKYQLSKDVLVETINSAKDQHLEEMLLKSDLNLDYYKITTFDTEGVEVTVLNREKAQVDLIDSLELITTGISINYHNSTLNRIIDSINNYLENNKTVSDFHLIKDIVDRNCDALEEEIHTQIPIPLYLGLVGTMSGILIGILYLWLSGGIKDLLSVTEGSGIHGVEALLGGVALAMISSILGIALTTYGSNNFKTVKSTVEKNKHTFLSWIQVKLLPTQSDNIFGAVREMTVNLTDFNYTFKDNTSNLGKALSKINESYKLQTNLIEAVNKLQEGNIATKNLALLSKLTESSKQIGELAEYLSNTNEYLTNVRILNEKIDLHESRTRTIEDIGVFFRKEIEHIEQRGYAMANDVTKVNDYLQRALNGLMDDTQEQMDKLNVIFTKQGDILQKRTEEIGEIVSELKQLSSIKDSISKFELATQQQNKKLADLTNAIQVLINTRLEVANIPYEIKSQKRVQPWAKAFAVSGTLLVGLVLLLLIIANWNSIYHNFIEIFRI